MPYTVGLYTLGCKVSQYETEAIAEAFEGRGFSVRDFDGVCDVYVINTCTVTAESDRKSRQMIRRAHHRNPHAPVLVTGCYAQRNPDAISRLPGVCAVTGSRDKMCLPDLALECLRQQPAAPLTRVGNLTGGFEPMSISHAPRTRAYVKIQDGCGCRCAYCAIPYARGPVCSKPACQVLEEVNRLCAAGSREIVLTGIETAAYGADLDRFGLTDLLELLERESAAERLRLGSMSPDYLMRPGVIERLAGLNKLAPHLHLSVQSGSDRILRAMRRRYLVTHMRSAMAQLRAQIPGIQFTADVIVGFPGEDEEMFAETAAFLEEARFLQLHVFVYSRRAGTPAADFPDQVPEEVKHERSNRLVAIGQKTRAEVLQEMVTAARPVSVILETKRGSVWHGHSAAYAMVETPAQTGDSQGDMLSVVPVGQRDGILLCRR